MKRMLFGPGTFVLGGGALLLILLLVVGALLPKEWSATAEGRLEAAAAAVLPYLDSPEGWRSWTTWPDSTTRSGPERGEGAEIRWTDAEVGSGSFRIDRADAAGVEYSVEVAGVGSPMVTRGRVEIVEVDGGTTLRWFEEGDLGSNPLMGWWALWMDRLQSTELTKSIEQLRGALENGVEPGTPLTVPDSVSVRVDSTDTIPE